MNIDLRQVFRYRNDCPEINEFMDRMALDPTDPRRRSVESHMASCPNCQTEWSLFRQFESGEDQPDEKAAVNDILLKLRMRRDEASSTGTPRRRRSFWPEIWSPAWMGGAALAAAALILTIGIASQWRARHTPLVIDSDQQNLRSEAIDIVTDLQNPDNIPSRIEWKPVAGAAEYSVSFSEVDGTQVFYAKVTNSALPMPEAPHKLLSKGRSLILAVTARDRSGREIARSGDIHLRFAIPHSDPR